MRPHLFIAFGSVVSFGLLASGCSKSTGSSLGVPAIRPPVQASLPAALLTGGTSFSLREAFLSPPSYQVVDYTQACSTDVTVDPCTSLTGTTKLRCIIKQRLFCSGPTEVLNLLNGLDTRMTEIDTRTTPSTACLASTASDHTTDLTFPGSTTFPHYLQCQDSSIAFGFGKKDDTWYLRNALGASAMVFSVNTAGTDVNGYLWLPSSDGTFSMSTGILQITADRTAGTVEFTGGGVGFGFCAIHYRSNASNVWIYMNPEGVGTSCDYDTSGVTDSADYSEICLNASDMTEVSASNCATLKADATLTLIGRAASTNASSTTWAASAPPSTGSIHRIDLNDLQTLFTHTATMTGVPSL